MEDEIDQPSMTPEVWGRTFFLPICGMRKSKWHPCPNVHTRPDGASMLDVHVCRVENGVRHAMHTTFIRDQCPAVHTRFPFECCPQVTCVNKLPGKAERHFLKLP